MYVSKLRTLVLASAFGIVAATAASAAIFTPQIPTPVNPHPAVPVATDGTPLPPMGWAADADLYPAVPTPDLF